MNANVMKFVKIGVTVASLGLTLATNYLAGKELDEKIAKKAQEAVAQAMENK